MVHVHKTSEWYSVVLGTVGLKLGFFELLETLKTIKEAWFRGLLAVFLVKPEFRINLVFLALF